MALVRWPPSVYTGWSSKPGESLGTRNMVRPLCLGTSGLVRARTKTCEQTWAVLVNIFCPLITHSSPSLTARVLARADVRARVRLGVAEGDQDRASEGGRDDGPLLLLGPDLVDSPDHHERGGPTVGVQTGGGHLVEDGPGKAGVGVAPPVLGRPAGGEDPITGQRLVELGGVMGSAPVLLGRPVRADVLGGPVPGGLAVLGQVVDGWNSISAPSVLEEVGSHFLVPVPRVPVGQGPRLGPAEVELDVVLQGVPVAPVEVQALSRDPEADLGGEEEGHGGQRRGIVQALVGRPRRLVGQKARPSRSVAASASRCWTVWNQAISTPKARRCWTYSDPISRAVWARPTRAPAMSTCHS